MLGYYGECIGERDPELVKQAEAQTRKSPLTCAPPTCWNQSGISLLRGQQPRRLRRHG